MLDRSIEPDRDDFLSLVKSYTVMAESISLEDEVYYHLRIYGDPLVDLLNEAAEKYSTDFSRLRVTDYGPAEGAEIIRPLLTMLGRRPYKSLTVGDLWNAIKAGRW
jgi:hypothetical protein